MKTYTVFKASAAVIAAFAGIYLFVTTTSVETPTDWKAWENDLLAARAEKNDFLKTDSDSPIPLMERAIFTELNYFAPDSSWVLEADVEMIVPPSPQLFGTSSGAKKRYLAIAKLNLAHEGTAFTLTLFQSVGINKHYFLPISDNTSARTTYGAGRYIDFEHLDGKQIYPDQSLIVDFNNAYNPYCAYASGFSCPIPPQENNILLEVLAGEKNY